MEKESSYPFGSDHFLDGAENYLLHKAMVNHDQQRIKTREGREVGDKVTRDLLEGLGGTGLDQGERRNGGVCVQLVLLAHSTAFDVFLHKLHETQSSELSSNKLMSLEVSRMTSSLVGMTLGKNRVVEGTIRGHIDASFVYKDMIVEFPVRKSGAEGSRNILQGRLQVLEDEGVGLGGVTNVLMQLSVNEVDK